MGTSMAFYWLENRNLTPDGIREKLPLLKKASEGKNNAMADFLMGMARQQLGVEQLPEEVYNICSAFSHSSSAVTAAFAEDAKWIPIFEANMCEGFNASSRDTDRLAELFGVPVLAFSIFDSDVLMVSYSDCERGVKANFAKPNFPEMEEFDTDCYRTEFPEFIRAYCTADKQERLMEIWNSEEYTFADDRMIDICELVGAQAIYSGEELPEGFLKIT